MWVYNVMLFEWQLFLAPSNTYCFAYFFFRFDFFSLLASLAMQSIHIYIYINKQKEHCIIYTVPFRSSVLVKTRSIQKWIVLLLIHLISAFHWVCLSLLVCLSALDIKQNHTKKNVQFKSWMAELFETEATDRPTNQQKSDKRRRSKRGKKHNREEARAHL